MITQAQAQYLLELPKLLTDNGNYLKQKTYSLNLPVNDRLFMASEQDTDFTFFLDIFQSSKKHIKLTLHFQEDETSMGLLRIDFNGRHQNPKGINEYVPKTFIPYAGQWIEDSHIHYYIEGYKPLAWAIPLTDDDSFPIKHFSDESEIGNIIIEFGRKINLQTKMNITIQTRCL
jgi:hypothetical protein